MILLHQGHRLEGKALNLRSGSGQPSGSSSVLSIHNGLTCNLHLYPYQSKNKIERPQGKKAIEAMQASSTANLFNTIRTDGGNQAIQFARCNFCDRQNNLDITKKHCSGISIAQERCTRIPHKNTTQEHRTKITSVGGLT